MIKRIAVLFALTVFSASGLLGAETKDHWAKLVVVPSNLNFFTCSIEGQPTPVPAPQTLHIRGILQGNNGDSSDPEDSDADFERHKQDSLAWTARPDQHWIQIQPDSGFTPDEASVTVDPAGLEAGEHRGTITFDTPGQKKSRIVQIKLRILPPAPGFVLNPDHVDFKGTAFSDITLMDSVHLGVAGAGPVDFTAANSQSWLKVVPSQGSAPTTVLLLAATDSLPPGTYYDTVLFRSQSVNDFEEEDHCPLNEVTARLPVTLTLISAEKPELIVTPGRLGFAAIFGGPNPKPQQLQISAEGAPEIPWTVRRPLGFLSVNPDSGTALSTPSTINVDLEVDSLLPGYHQTAITFLSSLSGVDSVSVNIYLQVFPPSALSDSVAIGDAAVDLTDPQINRFSLPIFASNTQGVRAIALPLHFADGQTTLDSASFTGGRAEFADIKLFLRLSTPGDFLILLGFALAPALPPGQGDIGRLYFSTHGVLPQAVDTLVVDSTSVPNATGDPRMPRTLSVSYLVENGANPLILNPAFKKGMAILKNAQQTAVGDGNAGNRPRSFGLAQNYPNPFNPQTAIAFSLPQATEVRLEVFNLLGRSVATLVEGPMSAGTHTVVWDGRDRSGRTVSSGIYLYRLKAGNYVETKKMLFLK